MGDLQDKSSNISIHNEDTDAPVTTTTDDSKERLDVSGDSPTHTEGGQEHIVVVDDIAVGVLRKILLQLKIMNIHLGVISDESIDAKDTDGI